MRKSLAMVVAACIVAGLTGLARAEQVDNPQYTAWSKAKVGTAVSYKMHTDSKMPGSDQAMKMDATMKQVLKEIKPEAITLEVTTVMTMNGQEIPGNTSTQTVPAKVEKGKEYTPPAETKAEISDMKMGKEKVEVNGKTYDAETREFTIKMTSGGEQGTPIAAQSKIWTSQDVPGGMLKTESKTTQPLESTTTIQLAEVTEKKD